MKAAVSPRYGQPEGIAIRDLPRPEPGPREVMVRIEASTVSRTDCGMLAGHPIFARAATGLFRPKLTVLGIDFAGTVAAVGGEVTGFSVGDAVFGLSPEGYGCHAEYLCLPETGAVALQPEGVAPDEAVICEGAWYAEMTVRRLEPGQAMLIYGASGAIGTAAVQLAKARGAEVTAVVATRHVALARSLGADRVIDYTAEDFTKLGARFDMVLDAVGKTSYPACRGLLSPGGRFCATDLGPGWSTLWLSAWSSLTRSGRVAIPFPEDARATVLRLRGLMAEGRLRGVFDRTFGLDEIVEAYRYVMTGQKTGIVRLMP